MILYFPQATVGMNKRVHGYNPAFSEIPWNNSTTGGSKRRSSKVVYSGLWLPVGGHSPDVNS